MAQAGSERSRQALQVTGRQAGTETDGEFGLIVRPCLFGACGHGASGLATFFFTLLQLQAPDRVNACSQFSRQTKVFFIFSKKTMVF